MSQVTQEKGNTFMKNLKNNYIYIYIYVFYEP